MRRYALAVALIAAAGSAGVAASGGRLEGPTVRGAILGTMVAALGAVLGMPLLARSIGRGTREFVGAVVFGMLGRLVLFCGVLIFVGLSRPAGCSITAVAASLLGFYFVFQALEVLFVTKRLKGARA
ncbi:MAG TPA: hypothetical protein VEW47_15925 [Candidatus Dormibacteraeota bacterium]|nr:hypothetical protein [Candidatus Dormibacteraeota bacterium]